MNAPHAEPESSPLASYRGQFWIPGEKVQLSHGTVQKGPLFVEWEVLDPSTKKSPVVLIHGGGGQGTDWITTLDGRPGWARGFVEAGYPVYVVDRVGHGRSPFHPDALGEMGPVTTYEDVVEFFAPHEESGEQTQWPWGRHAGDPVLDQLVSAFCSLPADLRESQELDADRISQLLDRIGPATLVTHSLGGPVGWLVADRCPDLVESIVALEPVGPEFADLPGFGSLDWGLTAAPVTYDPPLETTEAVYETSAEQRVIPALRDKDVLVIAGGASPSAEFAPSVVDSLNRAGARAEYMFLPEEGVRGNGHGIQMEPNSGETLDLVLAWLAIRAR